MNMDKTEIVDLIIRAGLLQDLLEWLRRRGVDLSNPMRPEELDEGLVEEYARERRLLDSGDELEFFNTGDRLEEELEPRELRPSTPPRK